MWFLWTLPYILTAPFASLLVKCEFIVGFVAHSYWQIFICKYIHLNKDAKILQRITQVLKLLTYYHICFLLHFLSTLCVCVLFINKIMCVYLCIFPKIIWVINCRHVSQLQNTSACTSKNILVHKHRRN